MAHLFSPITIARLRLANRIVMAPFPSGFAAVDGFVSNDLIHYYMQRAHGGVGLILTEPLRVVPSLEGKTLAHIGIYADIFIPSLKSFVAAIHEYDTKVIATLDAPAEMFAHANVKHVRRLTEQFILAAWRALAAGFDGVLLLAADGGMLHSIISPISNRRYDEYGTDLDGRLRVAFDIIENIRHWVGKRLLIGFRMVAEEFALGGTTLQDSRVIARRVVATGVNFLDVTAEAGNKTHVAKFPGWCIPLAASIKRSIPDVPVIGSGMLGEPYLADGVIREGSVDMVMLGNSLRFNPEWPQIARSFLV